MKKRALSLAMAIILFVMFVLTNIHVISFDGSDEIVTINDNELGWYGTDVYRAAAIGGLADTVRTEFTGAYVRPSDPNGAVILWLQFINYAGVREEKDMLLYKDLPEPLKGGDFSFYYWLANPMAAGSFGLEAIAYEKDGTAHSLGDLYEGKSEGMPWSGDNSYFGGNDYSGLAKGWIHYQKPLPAGKIIYKVAIRTFVKEDYIPPSGYYNSIPNAVATDQYYSRVAEISFVNTTRPESIIRDSETGWSGKTLRHTETENKRLFALEGGSSMLLRADINAGQNSTNTASVTKMLPHKISGGAFSFKLYSPFNIADGTQQFFTKVYAIAENGEAKLIGKMPETGALKFSGNIEGDRIFNGWNCFYGDLPSGGSTIGIRIDITDEASVQGVDLPFWMDDVKFIGSQENLTEDVNYSGTSYEKQILPGASDINDNEKGWYGLDSYEVNGSVLDTVRPNADTLYLSENDTDSNMFTWLNYINYPSVREEKDMIVYKDLENPLIGGSFSFDFWNANSFAENSFGLEAIAYDKDANAYSLGKLYDGLGMPWSGDSSYFTDSNTYGGWAKGWVHYERALPPDVTVVKMGIRYYVIDYPKGLDSVPNAGSPNINYSMIDGVSFDQSYKVPILRDNETGWDGAFFRRTETITAPELVFEGESSMLFRVDINTGGNLTNKASMSKRFENPLLGGYLSMKMYNSTPNSKFNIKVYLLDINGETTEIPLGYLRHSGTDPGNQIYNGWNNLQIPLPQGKSVSSVRLEFTDENNISRADIPIFIDDVKFVGTQQDFSNDINYSGNKYAKQVLSGAVNINDSEKGWYGLDSYQVNGKILDTVRPNADTLYLSENDTDSNMFTWLNYINYPGVREAKDMLVYKDLENPLIGGSFSFDFWNANSFAENSFGLEAIAYDKDANAYSLGKLYDGLGMPWSGDSSYFTDSNTYNGRAKGWIHYERALPPDVTVVKMGIRYYLINNPQGSGSVPNAGSPDINYSMIDGISFSQSYKVPVIRDNETGWDGVFFRRTETIRTPELVFEGESSMLFRVDINIGANPTINAALFKQLENPVSGGYLSMKMYNSAPNSRYRMSAYLIDTDGQTTGVPLGNLRHSGTDPGNQIYNGWNNLQIPLPQGKVIKAIRLEMVDENSISRGDIPIFIDDVKFVGSTNVVVNDRDGDRYTEQVRANAFSINDNELGWYSTDVYNTPEAKGQIDTTRPMSDPPYLHESDSDNNELSWLHYINYGGIREQRDMLVYKDLTEPLMGGSFGFYFWFTNFYARNSFGLEVIAYDMNEKAYSLGKIYDDTGLPWSGDDSYFKGNTYDGKAKGWIHYERALPPNVVVIKMAIRLYVIDNPSGSPSLPNHGSPNMNYSKIDGIYFKNTSVGMSYIRDNEEGWNGLHLRRTETITAPYLVFEGKSSMLFRGDFNIGSNPVHVVSASKVFGVPLEGGVFSFKLFNTQNPATTPYQLGARVLATDVNGEVHVIEGLPFGGAIKYSGTDPGNQIFNGWNCFMGKLPSGKQIRMLTIEITEHARESKYDIPFFIDDVKFIGTKQTGEDITYKGGANYKEQILEGSSDINDNELGWHSDDIYTGANGEAIDSVRTCTYSEYPADDYHKTMNKYVRQDTDPDNYSVVFLHALGDEGYAPKVYQNTIYKELSSPVMGGSFSFYFWFRNGIPANWNVFALEAIAYDKDGKEYPLGAYPDNNLLGWSGGENYSEGGSDDPRTNGWFFYKRALPPDVVVEKMGIRIIKPYEMGIGSLPGYGENWSYVDEIAFTNTTTPLDVVFDDEEDWGGEFVAMGSLNSLNYPYFVIEGDTALDFDADFKINGNTTSDVVLHKDFTKGVQGGRFSFKIFSSTNPSFDNQPFLSVKTYGITTEGERIDLGRCPNDSAVPLKFGGIPVNGQTFGGYNYFICDLPADKVIKAVDIVINDSHEIMLTINFFMDEIKFIASKFIDLPVSPAETKPDDNTVIEEKAKSILPVVLACGGVVIVLSASVLMFIFRKKIFSRNKV